MSRYGFPESINELAGTTNVAALTVLKAFTNLGSGYHTLLFALQNTDASNSVDMVIETSEDGVFSDTTKWTISTPAQKQGSLEVGPGLLRRFWRISAVTAGPTVAVKWAVRGIHRST